MHRLSSLDPAETMKFDLFRPYSDKLLFQAADEIDIYCRFCDLGHFVTGEDSKKARGPYYLHCACGHIYKVVQSAKAIKPYSRFPRIRVLISVK